MSIASRPTSSRLFIALILAYAGIVSISLPQLQSRTIAAPFAKKSPAPRLPNASVQSAARRDSEVLIKFRAGVGQQSKDTVLATHGARRKTLLRGESGVENLELLGGQSPEMASLQLQLQPEVEFAEPNFLIAKDQMATGDPRFNEQWALRNTGQNGGQFGADINVTTAWQTTTGAPSVVIAVIDSGIDFSHPDLANNRWINPAPEPDGDINGWDYITDTSAIIDEQGHGTSIAGIIAAEGNNAEGVSGVMWHAGLMSLRVLDNTGTGNIADAVEAIDYAVSHGAQVINISWGTSGESMALKGALQRAIRQGVVVVCSAGNGGQDIDQIPYYPASFNIADLIAVAASDNLDQLSSWSNRGHGHVSVAAPGTDILTTRMGGGYWMVTGTSASAPLVSGVAGLLKSYRPGAAPAVIRRAVENSARQVAGLTGQVSSEGVIDGGGALHSLRGNPYGGNGNGGGSNGGGNSQPYVPPGLRENNNARAYGREGHREPAPEGAQSAPGSNPNLNQLRSVQPMQPSAQQPIQANFTCADCDPQNGGGGSQYYPPDDPNFSTARTLLKNETGQTAVDLGSRNFNWSQTLLSLGGRGLDLNLTLFYNSLVWTRDGSFIKYNADLGTPAPGFRLGLPILQQRFINSRAGTNSYLMVSPSGGRVEMREVGLGVYESADGSNVQLKTGAYYTLTAAHSQKQVAVAGSSTANGAQIVQWPNPGGDINFEWQLVPTDSGYYKLVNHNSGKVAAVAGVSYANGANVVQWDWTEGAAHEQWAPVHIGNGYYRLVARHSGKVLQVSVGSLVNGAVLNQWSYIPASHQHFRIVPVASQNVTVRTADGTQYTFTPVAVNNEFRCTQIKDRNGNYITATYDLNNGHLQTITDTLGRVVTFVYYPDGNLQAIRQTWAGVAHDWATFSYGQVLVAPNFGGGLQVNGPNNNNVTVLTQVNLHDGSFFTFNYNAAFGQVNRINHHAGNPHLLEYMSYNMDTSAGQTDCPRFTERRDWAENWNGDNDGLPAPGEEAVTTFAVAGDSSWSKVISPDGTIYKEFFATTGWQTGLTTSTKNYANATDELADAAKKWMTISWTQDDVSLSFAKNPRVIETNIYDSVGNRRRTAISYGPYAAYSMPNEVIEYAADASTVLRRNVTDYNLSSVYLDRRIIGLVSTTLVKDSAGTTVSKTTFEYDWGGEYMVGPNPDGTQHDTANYGPTFITGRGNLSAVKRWDVTDIDNAAKAIAQVRTAYNSLGSVFFTRDALSHQKTWSYLDSFSDGVNRNTYASPTTVTDAEGFQSLVKYNFDHGAVTWGQTPSPNAGQTAPTVSFIYDSAGRIQKATNGVNGAFTEWIYPNTMTEINQLTTIDPNSITNASLRAFSTSIFDGAGRVRRVASDHPGSAGGFSGQYFIFDVMGRLYERSNPSEINGSWTVTGDDAPLWKFSRRIYDWNGRPTQTTNADGTTTVATYGGCGCAGGEVITLQDEHGRQRRLTEDIVGRLSKVEELNWNTSVYATTTYSYNVRDQITQSNQAGQLRSLTYDGYGRLQTRTTPEQGVTNYSYNSDDAINVVTDARGATTTFGYNPRHLVTSLTYGVPGGVAATPNVSIGYDPAGNRTSMGDGLGSATYGYDQLSRLTSETRSFNGVGSYTLSYGYNLASELSSVTNPWGAVVGYGYDKVGRVSGVTGSGYFGVSSYANSISYRAFGAIKGMNYNDGHALTTAYDNRLRATMWKVSDVLGYNYNYDYFNERTGRVTYAGSIYDPSLDRSYEYDNVGRLAISHSGAEARAHAWTGQWGTMDGAYSQGYDYDVWGNVTHKYGWGGEVQGGSAGQSSDINYSYTGNRRNGFSYDGAGNLTNDLGQTFTYDATGQQATASYGGYSLVQSYDGNGLRVKKNDNGPVTYYLRSSALGGQVVAEISGTGVWTRGYVYVGSQLLALQSNGVFWMHEDPITKSKRVTNGAGAIVSTIELDPWGADTNRSNNAAFQPRKFTSYERDGNGSDEAMFRRHNRWQSRFDQPDPYDGSYDFSDPQSFNRYAYVQNDPANFVDPTGLWGMGEGGIDPTKVSFGRSGGFLGGSSGGFYYVSGWSQTGFNTGNGWEYWPARPYSILYFFPGGLASFGSHVGGFVGALGGLGILPLLPIQPQETNPTNQRIETCVASVVAHYLGREALTLLKQQALNAGIGLGVLASRFFLGHGLAGRIAVGTMSEMGIEMFVKMHSVFSGVQYGLAAVGFGIKLYPKLVRESFNNKKEALRALKACFD